MLINEMTVHITEDGKKAFSGRDVALFSHMSYPRYLSRVLQKTSEKPDIVAAFPGFPTKATSLSEIGEATIFATVPGIEAIFQKSSTRTALVRALSDQPEETAPVDPKASGDEALDDDRNGGDKKFLKVIPATDERGPMADSRDVASYFGKRHKNLLQAFQNMRCSQAFRWLNFQPLYINGLDGDLSHVMMTKDGFSILVMGFTGEKAMALKETWLAAFNEMAKQLRQIESKFDPNDPVWLRNMLIEYTLKIEQAQAEIKAAQQETEEARRERIAAEHKADIAMRQLKDADDALESLVTSITENTGSWKVELFAKVQLKIDPLNQLREAMVKDNLLKRHFYTPTGNYLTIPQQWTMTAGYLEMKMSTPVGLGGVQVPVVYILPKGQKYILRRYWGKFKMAPKTNVNQDSGVQSILDFQKNIKITPEDAI